MPSEEHTDGRLREDQYVPDRILVPVMMFVIAALGIVSVPLQSDPVAIRATVVLSEVGVLAGILIYWRERQ